MDTASAQQIVSAEYEAIIASLKNKDNKGGKGNSGHRKKPNS